MEDRYESFIEKGMASEEAADKTVEAMGSAEEVAIQLAKLYPPFWPYMLRISRVVLVILLVLSLLQFKDISGVVQTLNAADSVPSAINPVGRYDPYSQTVYQKEEIGGVPSAERVYAFEPEYHGSINGLSMDVKKAALWNVYRKTVNETNEGAVLHVQIETRDFRFLFDQIGVDLGMHIWAEDNLGNYYYSLAGSNNQRNFYDVWAEESYIIGSMQRTGWFTYEYEVVLAKYVSHSAEWIDLHYDRDGRDYVLRIRLPEGGEQ